MPTVFGWSWETVEDMASDALSRVGCLGLRGGRLYRDVKPGTNPLESFWADSANSGQVVDRLKGTVFLAIGDDSMCEPVADSLKLPKLNPSGCVDVEAKVDGACRRPFD